MQTVINVEQLSKSYGNVLAADQISLSVKRGTVYGLLGANGAGKSTTIECILGTKNADSGTVSVLGYNPKKDRHRLFQNVGVQFQEGGYPPEIKVSELCEETACLYKALIPNPELVFLDELTTGLDAKTRRDVWRILSELKNKGVTIFLTSHFMDEVEALCDEICILKKGKAVFFATVKQAKQASGCEKFEDAYLVLSGEEVEKE